jgi:outer membrane biosynthesis protein TonB
LKRELLSSACGLALFIGGCLKRQAPPRIIYVAAPPAAAAPASSAPPESLVIEEPAPPPPPGEKVAAPEPSPPPPPITRRRRTLRTEPPPEAETPEAPAAEVPALEPHETSAQESALRGQIQSLQEDVRQRLGKVNEAGLSYTDRKTLEDARAFFAQSGRALQEGDLQRALTLARKASLLVSALEQTR